MEQNNEINSINEGTGTAIAVKQPEALSTEAPAPKKSGGFIKKIITALLACCVVSGGLLAAKLYLKPDPKTVVIAATEKTVSQQQKFHDKVKSDIPAAERLFSGQYADYQSNFAVTLNSVSGVSYAEMLNAFVSGLTVSGNSAVSQTAQTSASDFAVFLKDKEIVNGSLYYSPELMTVSIPQLTDKVLSANPQTFAQDYKNSIFFNKKLLSLEDAQTVQSLLNNSFKRSEMYSAQAIEKMNSDMLAIAKKAAVNAQYQYDGQTKHYIVTIPGADVKAAVIDFMRCIYAKTASENEISDIAASLEANLPELPTTITLDISRNIIRTANISCVPAASADDLSIDQISADLTFSPTSEMTQISAAISENGEQVTVFITAQSKLENDVYSASFIFDIFSGDDNISIPFSFSIASGGAVDMGVSLSASDSGSDIHAALSAKGTAILENGILTCDLPECSAGISGSDSDFAVDFAVTSQSEPLPAAPSAPSDHTPIFDMSYLESVVFLGEVSKGAQSIAGTVYGIFMG